MEKIKIAIIGQGRSGRNIHGKFFKSESNTFCDVVAVVELDEIGYVVADESTETNIPGVYAVGDVRTKELRQVVTAVSDGAAAVHKAEEYLVKL